MHVRDDGVDVLAGEGGHDVGAAVQVGGSDGGEPSDANLGQGFGELRCFFFPGDVEDPLVVVVVVRVIDGFVGEQNEASDQEVTAYSPAFIQDC